MVSFPSGGCVNDVDNQTSYQGFRCGVHFLQYHTFRASQTLPVLILLFCVYVFLRALFHSSAIIIL